MIFRVVRRTFAQTLPGQITSPNHVEVAHKDYTRPEETYKPSCTIEFDSKGETLLYSCKPLMQKSVFFPLPWSLGTWAIPGIGYIWYIGALSPYSWVCPIVAYLAIFPHASYLYNLRFNVDKMWYVRGGMIKIQNSGVYQFRTYTYTDMDNCTLISTQGPPEPHKGKFAVFLGESGEMTRSLTFQTDVWIEFYETRVKQRFHLLDNGEVHQPELFQAVIQGYKIDDSDMVVNKDPENSPVSRKCDGG